MTVEEIINLSIKLTKDSGHFNQAPSIDESLMLLNWAMGVLAEKARPEDHSVILRLSEGQGNYTYLDKESFSRRVIDIKTVYINGRPLSNRAGKIGLWSISELDRCFPSWRLSSSGTPRCAAQYGRGKVALFPKPNQEAVMQGNHYVYAEIVPGYVDPEGNYYRDTNELKLSPNRTAFGDGSSSSLTDLSSGGGSFTDGGGTGGGGSDGGCGESLPDIGADGFYTWPCLDDIGLQNPDSEDTGDGDPLEGPGSDET